MEQLKTSFSDAEIRRYGMLRDFPEDPSSSMLRSSFSGNEEALVRFIEEHPEHKPAIDFITAAVMAPGRTVRVFSSADGEYLRMRFAQHVTEGTAKEYAALYETGAENLLNVIQAGDLKDILTELTDLTLGSIADYTSTYNSLPEVMAMSPMEQLGLLGACDAALRSGIPERWFTAYAVGNAYDPPVDGDYNRICAAIAYAAGDWLLRFLETADFLEVLENMVSRGILLKRVVDGTPLYSLAEEYLELAKRFNCAQRRLAYMVIDKSGAFDLVFLLADDQKAWCFQSNLQHGFFLQPSRQRSRELLEAILPTGSNQDKPKFCEHCGKPLEAGSKFCTSCGKKVADN